MKARIFQTADGFEIVNCAGELFKVSTGAGGAFVSRSCGRVGASWKSGGRLLRAVPNHLKTTFFKLNKLATNE